MTHTEARLEDNAARTLILTAIEENLFVDAGAGSGKTSALVDRVVASVIGGDDPIPLANTAVVTFTEKAGAELRDRLRAAFERAVTEASDRASLTRAQSALDDLDAAAIGTLHSFAQRILAAFPIQAGMPPLVEVLDEVGSSVAFEARWSAIWRRMLDDDTLAAPLLIALASGITEDQLRSLARAFGSDWDLIESHVLAEGPRTFTLPETGTLARHALLLSERANECRDREDKFLVHVRAIGAWAHSMLQARSDSERITLLRDATHLKTSYGRSSNWTDLPGLKQECISFIDEARGLSAAVGDAALRPLARAIATNVLDAARERVASGQLEFHDLLVASRDLVRTNGDAREALQRNYQRLLLDEFQDTDPIQIELAVRIAGGRDASAPDWRDVQLPPGSLFVVGDPKQSIYRFRRASIETYLSAGAHFGRRVSLTTNFRTVPGVLDWVNSVFADVIVEEQGKQPSYEALGSHRTTVSVDDTFYKGAAVTVLGSDPHERKTPVALLREAEATDVASVVRTALAEQWTVLDKDTKTWRAVQARDIAVLIPARTSLPFLEKALEAVGIPYRTESSSLVYQASEIRSLMAAARAIADPGDHLSCVTALRSPLFGCGDDDLHHYRLAGGLFAASAPIDEALKETPVGRAMSALNRLYRRSRWLTPAEMLTDLAEQRRVLEVAMTTETPSRARDVWGRVRFVIDQARAWSDVQHGGLREYLAWAAHQAQDAARVAEALLPETDLDVVRIMTVHAAKGLEFGMVVLSGMTSQSNSARGVRLLWRDNGYDVRLNASLQTNDFADAAPLDEQMDDAERRRLLYVASTRARDHLVVSLHRAEGGRATAAAILADAGGADAEGAVPFLGESTAVASFAAATEIGPGRDFDSWNERVGAAREKSKLPSARTASGLEGTEPEVRWALQGAPDEAALADQIAGEAKGARDTELPPWMKGRYGNLIGRAVHGTLQIAEGDSSSVDSAAAAQALAEGIPDLADTVASYARSALATDTVQNAFASEHWIEMYVATMEDGLVLEGFIDLVYRDAAGDLVIVDYKTDTVEAASLRERANHYAPQLWAYTRALEAATGEKARAELVFLSAGGDTARVVEIPREPSA